jgi:hypothetical protein
MTVTRIIAGGLIASLSLMHGATLSADEPAAARQSRVRTADSPELTRQFVSQLPVGSVVKIDLVSREKLTATLMAVTPTDIVVKPKTRVPEPARAVPFDQIVRIEPKGQGASVTKAVLIGAAAGAATFFGLWLFAVSVSD